MGEPALKVEEVSRGANEATLPQMAVSLAEMRRRLAELRQIVDEVMVEGVHYGPPYPGSDKLVLYKPGGELLMEIYGYRTEPILTHRIEKWTREEGGPFFHYEFETFAYSKKTSNPVGKGFGSCNSREPRYRYRYENRSCPECGAEAIMESHYDPPAWYCNKKKNGCGAKFRMDDDRITSQTVGRVENDQIENEVNTILKVGKKRSCLDVTISVTQSAGLFEPEDDDKERGGGKSGGKKDTGNKKSDQGKRSSAPANGTSSNQPKPGDDGRIEIHAFGRTYRTLGITGPTFMKVIDACKAYDKANAETKDAAKIKLRELTGKDSTKDLTEAEGKKFDETLRGILNGTIPEDVGTHPADQPGDANDDDAPY